MLIVKTLPAFEDNYIWLITHPDTAKVIIVDPGDADLVVATMKKENLTPVAILITHADWDHIDGIEALIALFSIPVYGSKIEPIPKLSHAVKDQDKLQIEDFPVITVLDTPGHRLGHVSFLIEDNLFCGDTLFLGGCGRVRNEQYEEMFKSLQTIKHLPANTNIYCTHEYTQTNLAFAAVVEPKNTAIQQRQNLVAQQRNRNEPSIPAQLQDELDTNPFLRTDQPTIKKAVESYSNRLLNDEFSVFKALRLWKDAF